jgi:hypothetical protein
MAGKMGFQMKKYTQMSDEVEQLDADLTEQLKKLRADIEALDWDTSKVNMTSEDREAEFKRIAGSIANVRSVHQVSYSQCTVSTCGGRGPHNSSSLAQQKKTSTRWSEICSCPQTYRVEMRDLGRDELAHYEPKAKAHLNTIEE